MKKVNFITSLSPQKQYAIARWFWMTLLLSVCCLLVNLYFIVPEFLMYLSLKKEVVALREKTKKYDNAVKDKNLFKTEQDVIRVRTKKLDNYTNVPKNPHQYIAAIVQSCGGEVVLETINFNKKNCELTLLCPTPEHATVFIKRLSATELFNGVKLVSLQYDGAGKQFRCIVRSNIVG